MNSPNQPDVPDVIALPFSFHEVATALVKQRDIHDGYWSVYVEFALTAANVHMKSVDEATAPMLFPTALVPVKIIGLQRHAEPNELTVDASKVNAKPKTKSKAKPKGKPIR